MYDLQPPFLGPRRVYRSSLKPKDAAAMIAQSHRLSKSKIFRPPSPDTHPVGKWHSPAAFDSYFDKTVASNTFAEYSPMPEVTRPNRQTAARRPQLTPLDFESLPKAVIESILEQLRHVHTGRSSSSCTTCHMRDLHSLQLSSKKLGDYARTHLYKCIDISGEDSVAQLKRYKTQRGSRLRLLRRTLRGRGDLAELVRELNVPDPNIPLFLPDGRSNPAFEDYRDLVASLVMACPKLEKLTGFHTWYNHEFDRLTHALSTRPRLREHCWIITENDAVTERSQVQLSPGLLDDKQIYQFLHYNRSWRNLETLMLCSPGGSGVIEHHVFEQLFRSLPLLRNLCISSFDADDFTDITLLSLPPRLTGLRLEECAGISDSGLSRWAARPGAEMIQTLSLIHQNLHSLLTVAKLLACLNSLSKFTFVQSDLTPTLPTETVVIQPVMASSSLNWLHWDVLPEESFFNSSQESPNSHLASSILHGGFPKLHFLRAPRDLSPPGALQEVCRPATLASVILPTDNFNIPAVSDVIRSPSKSALSRGNSLRTARIRAQGHIDANSKAPKEFMRVLITDHSMQESLEDDFDSSSSSTYSDTSTEGTDPNDLFSPTESKLAEFDFEQSNSNSAESLSCSATNRASISHWPLSLKIHTRESSQSGQRIPIPARSPLRPRPIRPLKISEFSVPSFIGRVGSSAEIDTSWPPKFNLKPDVEDYDSNGGIIGWGDLLRVSEKARPETEDGKPWIIDGCSGAWNKGQGKSPDWWKHTERSRRRIGRTIEIHHFF